MGLEIEEVASWPWRRRLFYAVSLSKSVPDSDEYGYDFGSSKLPDELPSGVNMPSHGHSSDIPQSLRKHENVITTS